jgi:hypothetical protein
MYKQQSRKHPRTEVAAYPLGHSLLRLLVMEISDAVTCFFAQQYSVSPNTPISASLAAAIEAQFTPLAYATYMTLYNMAIYEEHCL